MEPFELQWRLVAERGVTPPRVVPPLDELDQRCPCFGVRRQPCPPRRESPFRPSSAPRRTPCHAPLLCYAHALAAVASPPRHGNPVMISERRSDTQRTTMKNVAKNHHSGFSSRGVGVPGAARFGGQGWAMTKGPLGTQVDSRLRPKEGCDVGAERAVGRPACRQRAARVLPLREQLWGLRLRLDRGVSAVDDCTLGAGRVVGAWAWRVRSPGEVEAANAGAFGWGGFDLGPPLPTRVSGDSHFVAQGYLAGSPTTVRTTARSLSSTLYREGSFRRGRGTCRPSATSTEFTSTAELQAIWSDLWDEFEGKAISATRRVREGGGPLTDDEPKSRRDDDDTSLSPTCWAQVETESGAVATVESSAGGSGYVE